jgi:hypothetical protein
MSPQIDCAICTLWKTAGTTKTLIKRVTTNKIDSTSMPSKLKDAQTVINDLVDITLHRKTLETPGTWKFGRSGDSGVITYGGSGLTANIDWYCRGNMRESWTIEEWIKDEKTNTAIQSPVVPTQPRYNPHAGTPHALMWHKKYPEEKKQDRFVESLVSIVQTTNAQTIYRYVLPICEIDHEFLKCS